MKPKSQIGTYCKVLQKKCKTMTSQNTGQLKLEKMHLIAHKINNLSK